MDVIVKVRIKEIFDRGLWNRYCEHTGTNEWAVNEGLIDSSEIVELSETEAVNIGLIKPVGIP